MTKIDNETRKLCRTCHFEKPLDEFWKDKRLPDGRQKDCILCAKAHWRKRATPEKRKDWGDAARRVDDYNIQRYLLRSARKRAKEKGIECTISTRDITLRDICPILRIPLVKNKGQWASNSYSLDRRDSSKGYIPGNVEVVSWKANSLKGALTVEQVERLLEYMKGTLDPSE